jgi:hypothetical protein
VTMFRFFACPVFLVHSHSLCITPLLHPLPSCVVSANFQAHTMAITGKSETVGKWSAFSPDCCCCVCCCIGVLCVCSKMHLRSSLFLLTNATPPFVDCVPSPPPSTELQSCLTEVLTQLGPDSLSALQTMMSKGGAGAPADDDEVPDLVENFDTA